MNQFTKRPLKTVYRKKYLAVNELSPKPMTRLLSVVMLVTFAGAAWGQDQRDYAPYNLKKFRPVLDNSKLQAPTSSPTLIEKGKFTGKANEYFFLDPTGQYMTFTVEGDKNRSELRQETGDWDTATKTPQRMLARVKVYVPEDKQLEQYTFLQIHDKKEGDKGLNKPLLRVTLRGNYKNTRDHIWAVIRTPKDYNKPISLKNLATENVDLGPRPNGFFNIEVRVQNSHLGIAMGGQIKVNMNVSYWDGLENYFKAGVYNQDPGRSKVEFELLQYADSD